MSDYYAIAEYESLEGARVGIEVLEKSHFTEDEVSLVTGASDSAINELQQLPDVPVDKPADGRAAGLGMLIGGAAATPLAMGTMVGPFMVAGPLLGLALGAGGGSLFEGTESESLRNLSADYESRVKAGSVLIFVAVDSRVRLDDAVNSLITTGPKSLERIEA
ncbi:MAG: hypothetical protein ACO1RT_13590 [Planctomycetaceae bacterium]